MLISELGRGPQQYESGTTVPGCRWWSGTSLSGQERYPDILYVGKEVKDKDNHFSVIESKSHPADTGAE